MKFMNMKRFASMAMAGALTLSLATPAFAANNIVITGTYADIEIAVEVPTTGTAQINPYGLPVSIDKSDKTTVDLVGNQITTQPMSIKNQSAIPLEVGATLAVVPKGDVSIVSTFGTSQKGKEIAVDLEVAALNDSALAVATTDRTLEDKLIDKFAADATWSALSATSMLSAPAAAKGATTVAPASGDDLAELGAATVDGRTTTYGPKSIALFRLSGDLNEAPVTGSGSAATPDPWKEADGFEATVAFTFKPADRIAITVTQPTSGGTIAASANSAWEGTVITLTGTPTTASQTATFTVTESTPASGATPRTVTVTNGTFVMPDYAVTVTATFS